MTRKVVSIIVFGLFGPLSNAQEKPLPIESVQTIIKAVNTHDPNLYVSVFAEDVRIWVEDVLKISNRDELLANRKLHLKKYSNAISEIQHLVEIDNKVIMHDRVWLQGKNGSANEIVEIFTFDQEGKIYKVNVIQPLDLFDK